MVPRLWSKEDTSMQVVFYKPNDHTYILNVERDHAEYMMLVIAFPCFCESAVNDKGVGP